MCKSCQKEYDNPIDRRYYSQTNSCPDCGIQIGVFDAQQQQINIPQAEIIQYWETGNIVALI